MTRASANLLCFVPASSANACHLATDEFQASWSWAFTADALSTGNGSFFLRGAHLIAGFLNGWAVLMTLKSLRRELSRPKLPEGNCLASGGAANFCLFTTACAMMLEFAIGSGALVGASSDCPICCWNAFVSQGASNGSGVLGRSDCESNPFQKAFPEKICLNRSMAIGEADKNESNLSRHYTQARHVHNAMARITRATPAYKHKQQKVRLTLAGHSNSCDHKGSLALESWE